MHSVRVGFHTVTSATRGRMERVSLVVLSLSILVAATLSEDEDNHERHEQLLGGIQELTRTALDSPEAYKRVESALAQLSTQNGGCLSHRPLRIRSGTRQVVNGFKFSFVVEVERSSSGECDSAPGVSEIYRILIYEPAARDEETEYTFEKLPTERL